MEEDPIPLGTPEIETQEITAEVEEIEEKELIEVVIDSENPVPLGSLPKTGDKSLIPQFSIVIIAGLTTFLSGFGILLHDKKKKSQK